MTRRFFSGNSLDQAVMVAARHYGVDPAELAYRQIEKRHGFLRTRKAVVIAVDPDRPKREPAERSPEAAAPAVAAEPVGDREDRTAGQAPSREELADEPAPLEPPALDLPAAPLEAPRDVEEDLDESWRGAGEESDRLEGSDTTPAPETEDEPEVDRPAAAPVAAVEHDRELLDAAERAAHRLMGFAGIEADARAHSGDERVDVEIEGPDATVLVVEGGKGLLAIQHLLPRLMRGMTGRSSFVRVDSQEFHRKRRERLEALALKEAEAVSRNGTPRTLPPMAPDERRIVHLAVQEIPTVVTESRGSGLHKRVVIRPAAADGGHDDIEARHGF